VTIGVLLATISLGVLIFFIHHVAESIQVSSLIDRVGTELDDAIFRLFPQNLGKEDGPAELPTESATRCTRRNQRISAGGK